jgi:hypothetical protein
MRYLCSFAGLLLLGAPSLTPAHAVDAPGVLIHEIELGESTWIEVHNFGAEPADLTGWELHLFDGSGWSEVYTFPSFALAAGGYVVLHEGGSSADDTATELYTGFGVPWSNTGIGAAELLTGSLGPADYLEFGQHLPVDPVHEESWSGSYGSVVPVAGKTLGREPNGPDTDRHSDWCGQLATPGAANGDCTCSVMIRGGLAIDPTIYGTWGQDDVDATWPDGTAKACNSFTLSWARSAQPPFSLEAGVTLRVFAGKTVVFNSGTSIPSGAKLVVGVDPQLRQ